MQPRPGVRFGVLAALLVGACVGAATAAPVSTHQPSVLILLPGQPGLPAASLIATGIRSSLISEWSFRVSIEVEHVDIALFPSPELEEARLRAMFGSKYANRAFDLIIAASNEPLQFVLRQRDELWPGVPVIVCAVDERSLRGLVVPPDVRLVTIRYDVDGTLRAALALLPDTERVALAGGAGPQERTFHDLARQAVAAADKRLDLIDLTALPITDLMARVSALPEHTIVLASSYQVDATGRRLYGLDIIGPLTLAANRPTFNMFSQVLGRGIVGGSMTDFEAIGREAGALGLRALRGEASPGSPLASAVGSVPRFDARQLTRWGLDERRLAPGSEVLYREPTLWQLYRWHIAGMISLIGVQAVLIIALLLQRRRRHEAQALLAERLRFERLVNEVATALTSAPVARLDGQIRECLERVVTFIDVDRGALWQLSPDGSVISPSHVWHRQGAPPPATIDLRVFTYLRARTAPGQEGLSFTRLGELPPEAAAERAAFEAQGVRSLATVPLAVGDRLLGLLAFVSVTVERAWPPELMQQLRTLADHFSHALIRAQSAAAVESSAALAGAVLAALPGETAIIDSAGVILQTNETWVSAARSVHPECQPALAVGANYLETCRRAVGMPADVAWKVHGLLEDVLRGAREEFAHEYPAFRPDGERWLEIRVRRLAYLGGGAAVTPRRLPGAI
jgi:GAF domain-containing protein